MDISEHLEDPGLVVRAPSQADGQIWVYDVARGTLSRLTREWDADFPVWHPHGESLAFVLSKGESSQIARVRADGSEEPETLWSGGANVTCLGWAPDGRSLVFSDVDTEMGTDLWILDLDGEIHRGLLFGLALGGGPR